MTAKITVKKLSPIFQINKRNEEITYFTGNSWGVFKNDELMKSSNGQYEVYPLKSTASKVAESYS